jgi:hypothetical protein
VGCPIRRSRDQRLLASPPGFSQRATSFIASQCQGIHQMPFIRASQRHTQRQQSSSDPVLLSQRRWSNDAPSADLIRGSPGAHQWVGNPLSTAEQVSRRMKTLSGPHGAPAFRQTADQPGDARIPPRSHNSLIHICPSTIRPPASQKGPAGGNSCLLAAYRFGAASGAPTGSGGERVRTDDLLLAKQALSQLSYTPFSEAGDQRSEIKKAPARPPAS